MSYFNTSKPSLFQDAPWRQEGRKPFLVAFGLEYEREHAYQYELQFEELFIRKIILYQICQNSFTLGFFIYFIYLFLQKN